MTGREVEGRVMIFSSSASSSLVLELNPLHREGAAYGPSQWSVINKTGFAKAWKTITSWPGYKKSPLKNLAGAAATAKVDCVFYKDESDRFGLGSFKALGGAYAVARLLTSIVATETNNPDVEIDELRGARYRAILSKVTVSCATDGNHGRSVAWGAQMFGCQCVIFVHAKVSAGRQQAIEKFGARIVRTSGNYDQSVQQAQSVSRQEGWYVVSDTSYEGYLDVPRDVMQGYTIMAEEAIRQFPDVRPPTHLFLQTGVGGMAAAVCGHMWQYYGRERPKTVLADPAEAACWLASLLARHPVVIEGELDTVMAGLACGEVSLLAWKILSTEASAVVSVDDTSAMHCMRLLADGRSGDRPIVAGESAVAGLAGFLAVSQNADARKLLGLDTSSRVLVFGTEGDTDPDVFRDIVGRSSQEVLL